MNTIHNAIKRVTLALVVILGLILGGCSANNKIAKSGTPQEKLELAKSYYKKQEFHRSLPLFQELLGVFRESNISEEIYYYIAYSYYGMKEYEAAGKHFYNFTETFFNSKKTEECFYMYCLCQFHASNPYYLDQGLTKRAIENFQLFLNLFPASIYQEDANLKIDELRNKLKKKAYESALLYYKMEDYKAAIVTLTACLESFPDMEEKELIELTIVRSAFRYAQLSIQEKQLERYKEALRHYEEYERENRQSGKMLKEALDLKIKIEDQIEKLTSK
jgi:outer membrane protein assembly factor BamD